MENIKNIIIKNILGDTLSNEEEKVLKNWLENNSSNAKIFERLKTYELSKIILAVENEDLGREMANDFLNSINIIKKRRQKNIVSKIAYTASAAAILAISFFVSNHSNRPETRISLPPSQVVISSEDSGSNNNIRLITADKVVNLDKEDITEKKISIDRKKNQISFNNSNSAETETLPQINTLIVPLKRECHLILPDGSRVWVNSGSKLMFPEKFSDTLRSVELIGEAYFEIVRNEKAPFIVKTQNINTYVWGTKFMVSCYENKEEVALVDGSIMVNKNGSSKHIVLKPGHGVVLDKENSELKEVEINTEQIAERKNGLILFDEKKLSDIASDLENIYGVNFLFENESLKNERFYIRITRQDDIQYIMQLLRHTKKINYKIENNKITIKKYMPMEN